MIPPSDCAIDCSEYVKKIRTAGNYERGVKFCVLLFYFRRNYPAYIDFGDVSWYNESNKLQPLYRRRVLSGENDLATTHPEIAAQWHPTKNGSRTPQMVVGSHHAKVWWLCSEGHVWKAIIRSRAGPQKCGCPVCAGKVKLSSQMRYAKILTCNKSDTSTVIE